MTKIVTCTAPIAAALFKTGLKSLFKQAAIFSVTLLALINIGSPLRAAEAAPTPPSGPAAQAILQWFSTDSSLHCLNQQLDDSACTVGYNARYGGFSVYYGDSTGGGPQADALAFVYYFGDPTGNAMDLAIAYFHRDGGNYRFIKNFFPDVFGQGPIKGTTVRFLPGKAKFSMAVLGDRDARCCPTGRANYTITLNPAPLTVPVVGNAQNPSPDNSLYYVANTRPPDAYLSLRTNPTSSFGQRIMTMPNGTVLRVLQRQDDGWWHVKVVSSDQEGWALSRIGNRTFIECCTTAVAGPVALSKDDTWRECVTAPGSKLCAMTAAEQKRACELGINSPRGPAVTTQDRQDEFKMCLSTKKDCQHISQFYARQDKMRREATPVVFSKHQDLASFLKAYPVLKKSFSFVGQVSGGEVLVAENRTQLTTGGNILFVMGGGGYCTPHGCVLSVYLDTGTGYKKAFESAGSPIPIGVFRSPKGHPTIIMRENRLEKDGRLVAPKIDKAGQIIDQTFITEYSRWDDDDGDAEVEGDVEGGFTANGIHEGCSP